MIKLFEIMHLFPVLSDMLHNKNPPMALPVVKIWRFFQRRYSLTRHEADVDVNYVFLGQAGVAS